MDAYHALAVSYDRLTNDVDYQATVDFYNEILKREGLRPSPNLHAVRKGNGHGRERRNEKQYNHYDGEQNHQNCRFLFAHVN